MDSRFSTLNRWKLHLRGEPDAVPGGFSGAVVFRIDCDEGLFALRGWPEGAEPRRLDSLHRLLEHVANAGVPVAIPLRGIDGNRLQQHVARWWQVEPWLRGTADFRAAPTRTKLESTMAALAGFHVAASSFRAHATDEWFGGRGVGVPASVRERRQIAEERLHGDALTALRHRVERSDHTPFADLARKALFHIETFKEHVCRDLLRAEVLEVPLLPVVRDIWHDHVLFSGDRVTGLIDLSAARRDTAAADLSRLLGSMLGDGRREWEDAIALYEAHRALTDNERVLIPILDRSGVLFSAMNWLRRHYLEGVDCDTPAVLARLAELVSRLEHL